MGGDGDAVQQRQDRCTQRAESLWAFDPLRRLDFNAARQTLWADVHDWLEASQPLKPSRDDVTHCWNGEVHQDRVVGDVIDLRSGDRTPPACSHSGEHLRLALLGDASICPEHQLDLDPDKVAVIAAVDFFHQVVGFERLHAVLWAPRPQVAK